MKKLLLFAMFLGLGFGAYSQTYLLEDFSGGIMPPTNWTINGVPAQWSINQGNEAGGDAPEAMFSWLQGNNTSRLISPEIDLSGLSIVMFQFSHFLDDYSGTAYTLGVATRQGAGADWNDVWTVNPSGNIGPEEVSIEISNDDVGATNFQFCIYITGNTYNLDNWYIDDVWLFLPVNLDAGISNITTNTYLSGPAEITGTVKNFGATEITDLDIAWQVDGGETTSTSLTGLSVAFGETYAFTLNGMFNQPIGTHTLSVMIEAVNGDDDEDPSNDMLEKTINVVSHSVQHQPCLEEFTSSSCAPCATFNAQFVPWCNNHADEITLVKYQMNWPGVGDPYYTAEGGVRRNQYNVTWVPWANLDGTYTDNNMGVIQSMFEASLLEVGLVNIAAAHTLNGTVMDINVNIVPFTNMSNIAVYIVVFEYLTTENATTNGETEFEHVMMKMVPNASGTSVSLTDREPYSIMETVDLAGTNVEEWDDLGVAVIVQDKSSLYVYQSAYTIEDADYSDNAELSEIMIDGVALPDFAPDVYEYTVVLEDGTVLIPNVEATTAEANALPVIVPAFELPGVTTIDVFAEDMATKITYTITFDLDTDIIENASQAISIFPNPSNGKLYITGVENAQVTIYNTAGSVMGIYKDFKTGAIDLSKLNDGIYIVNVLIDNKTILNKKVSILK